MNIQCDNCKTGYKINPAKLPLSGAVLTCKNCGGKFRVEHPDAKKADPPVTKKELPETKRKIPDAKERLPAIKRKIPGARQGPPGGAEEPVTPAPVPGKTFTPSSDISDSEYAAFIQKNTDVYLRKFKSFHNGDFAATWHWPAFFFPLPWFLYRKLYSWALLSFILGFIPMINLLIRFCWGFTANHLYYKKVRATILEIKRTTPSTGNLVASGALRGPGGVNAWIMILAVIPIIGILAAIAIPNFIAYRDKAAGSLAQTCMEEAVAAQEAYFEENMGYASNIEELSGEYAICDQEGMSLHIYSAGSETYFMESVRGQGRARYISLGPTSDIAKLNTRMATFPADGGAFQVTAPVSWEDLPSLNDEAELTIGSASQGCFLIGFFESRDDAPGMDGAQYSELVRAPFIEGLQDPEHQRTAIRSIAGYEAFQYKIAGVFPENNIHLTYLHTVIEGDDNFYQLIGWTESRNFDDRENLINYMMMRFEEL